MTLSTAMRILLTPFAGEEYINDADKLLSNLFINFYGEQYVSQNIHALVYLADDCKR